MGEGETETESACLPQQPCHCSPSLLLEQGGLPPRPDYYVAAPPGPPMYPAPPVYKQEASSSIPWWVWMGAGILIANVARLVSVCCAGSGSCCSSEYTCSATVVLQLSASPHLVAAAVTHVEAYGNNTHT